MEISNKYGKEGAIMETGYSTWLSSKEASQKNFINLDLRVLMKFIVAYNNKFMPQKITLGCWYELQDGIHWVIKQF